MKKVTCFRNIGLQEPTRLLAYGHWTNKWTLLSNIFRYCLFSCGPEAAAKVLSLWMKLKYVTIEMNSIVQYFHVVLFVTLYKVVLTFKTVNDTLVCDHSNESYWAVLSCLTVNLLSKVVLTFKSVDETAP